MVVLLAGALLSTLGHSVQAAGDCAPNLAFDKRKLAGDEEVRLCEAYRDKVVLIVNTASKCGYTPQFDGLEALYRKYRADGLVVLGFPSNDFAQEYQSEEKIRDFCRLTYSVEFPMFAGTSVREGKGEPLYQSLGSEAGEFPRWNFHKYLLGRDGRLVGSYRSQISPDDAEHIVDLARPGAAAGAGAAGRGVGRGHIRISAVVDIEERALRPLVHHVPALTA